jgi:diacylglycerol kinase family enzyme
VQKCFSLVVTKIKFYGYGILVVPQAKMDDGKLHTLLVSLELFDKNCGLAAPFIGGNRGGAYRACRSVSFTTKRAMPWQVNGSVQGKAKKFDFRVLPGALKLVY